MKTQTKSPSENLTKRERYEKIRAQLEYDRTSFIPTWRDLADYILPRRPRFFVTDVNRGDRRSTRIIDSTATLATRTLRSGMMTGITSPARPWFRLTTPDPKLSESAKVKEWLDTVKQRMLNVFFGSNLYQALPMVYGDMGVFATGAVMMEEDMDDVVRFYVFPIGSYMIGTDARGQVSVFFRVFQMTVRQLVEKFGRKTSTGDYDWANFSGFVKDLYQNDQKDQWVAVCHIIEPNEKFDDKKLHSKYKRFSSCYYERGVSTSANSNYMDDMTPTFLRESGYDRFPVMCPRWEVTGEDAYGTASPGWQALGDIKQLQLGEKEIAKAVQKMVNPPLVGPASMRATKASILPGDITYVDERDGMKGFRPVHEVDPRIKELIEMQQMCRGRISRAFYEDLFLMMANTDRRDMTAREVDERSEEKLLALGPMLEQMNQDLLDPLIEGTFEKMLVQGLIPPPPQELDGLQLKIEYESIMAQAQKLVGVSGVERYVKFALDITQITQDPSVMDKVDLDRTMDVYGDYTSVPPGVVRATEDAQAIRQQRAKAQAQAQEAEQAATAAKAAKDAGSVQMDQDNLVTRLANAGAPTPQLKVA